MEFMDNLEAEMAADRGGTWQVVRDPAQVSVGDIWVSRLGYVGHIVFIHQEGSLWTLDVLVDDEDFAGHVAHVLLDVAEEEIGFGSVLRLQPLEA